MHSLFVLSLLFVCSVHASSPLSWFSAFFEPTPVVVSPLHNWGGNFNYSTQDVQHPRTLAEVQRIVASVCKLRVLGSRHSFSTIADTDGTLMSMLGLNSVVRFNNSVPSVTVQAGITYTDLTWQIQARGFALANLAALAEITVGGALATGVHGSGNQLQALATQVRSLQMVLANGSLATYGPDHPQLKAVAIGLGSLGVLTEVELRLEPTYNTTRVVFLKMSMENALANFDAIQRLGYSVYMLALSGVDFFDLVRINVRSDANSNLTRQASLFGAQRSPARVGLDKPDTGIEAPWYKNLLAFTNGLSGVDGNESQSEYLVPYENATAAIRASNALYPRYGKLLTAMNIRTVRGDDLWMSPFHGQGQLFVAIHYNWLNDMPALEQVVPEIEAALVPFGVRPHLAKLHRMDACYYQQFYPRLNEFRYGEPIFECIIIIPNYGYVTEKVFKNCN